MRKKKQLIFNRILSVMLSLVLTLSGTPLNAYAEGTEEQTGQQIVTVSSGEETGSQITTVSEGDAEVSTAYVVIPAPTTDLPGNDELFAGYAEQYIFSMGGNATTFAELSGNKLATDADKRVYAALKTQIASVAANGGSSKFVLDVSDMGVIFTVTGYSEERILGTYNIDVEKIIDALLVDCPYELYWFNKTASMSYGTNDSFSSTLVAGDAVELQTFAFNLPVATAYQGADTYTVSAEKVTTATTAKTNADKVITEASTKGSVYDQLRYCLNYIKDNVDYGENTSTDMNTWQMIWVFDNDSTTNVVCEGYAKAFKYLCDGIGVECYTVTGVMGGGTGAGNHMWNIVVLDGKNYLVDPTNCDGDETTQTVGYPYNLFLKAPNSGSGTAAEPYTYTFSENNYATFYYDDDTTALLGNSGILTLATEDYAVSTTYTVTIADTIENGTVTANVASAAEGDTITLTVEPGEGYELDTLTVTYGENQTVTVTDNKFTMPAGNVTVTATFKAHTHNFNETTGACTVTGCGEYKLLLGTIQAIDWVKMTGGELATDVPDTMGTSATGYNLRSASLSYVDFENGAGITIYNKTREETGLDNHTATYTLTNGVWTSEDCILITTGDSIVATCGSETLPTDQSGGVSAADRMTADGTATQGTALDLNFGHELTKVTVKIATWNSEFPETDRSIRNVYIYTKDGTAITAYADGETFTAILPAGSYTADQTFMTLTVNDGITPLTVPVNKALTTGLQAGKHYTFNLTVGQELLALGSDPVDYWPYAEGWNNEVNLLSNKDLTTKAPGKTGWETGDKITLTLPNADGELTYQATLTYDGSKWAFDAEPVYDLTNAPTVKYDAVFSNEEGEYLKGSATIDGSTLTVTFEGVKRSYSRLRILGAVSTAYTVTVTGFTPADGSTAETSYTLTTDGSGNAYLYGTFAEGSRIVVTNTVNTAQTTSYTFPEGSNGSESEKSYALCVNHTAGSYSANGAAITDSCTKCGTELGTATISADNTEYTGSAYDDDTNVTVTGSGTLENKSWTITYAAVTASDDFEITAKELTSNDVTITLSADSFDHTSAGTEHKPTVTSVVVGGTATLEASEYDVTYSDNTAPGTGKVTVSFKGNYSGTVEKTFTIVDKLAPIGEITISTKTWNTFLNTITFDLFFKDTANVTVTADGTGSDVTKVEYLLSETVLTENFLPDDGWEELTASNGVYSFSVPASQKAAVYVRITDGGDNTAVINSDGIVVYKDSAAVTSEIVYTYKQGENQDVSVTLSGNTVKSVACGETELTRGNDYSAGTDGTITLTQNYLDTLSVGTYTFTVSYNPMGVTTATVTLTTTFSVKVEQASIEGANVIVSGTYTYDGTAKMPEPVVTLSGETLTKDTDYTVSYTDNTNAGTATVTVTGTGNYTGEATGTFTIGQADSQLLTGDITVTNGHAYEYTFDLSGYKPSGTDVSWGDSSQLSYTLGDVDFSVNGYYDTSNPATVSGTTLSLPIKAVESTDTGEIGTISIKNTSQNYAESSLTLTVKRANKTDVSGSITLSVADITYGDDPAPTYSFGGTSGTNPVWTLTYSKDSGASWYILDDLKVEGKLPAGDYMAKAHYEDLSQLGEATTSFKVSKANPIYTAPTGLTAIYGDTLADVVLPSGWKWNDAADSVGNVGSNTFKATFTPTDTANYNTAEVDLTVTVAKATPVVVAPTAVTGLVYSGSEQNLINEGSTTGGTLMYKLGDGEWSTAVPTAAYAGEYTVSYKVAGDDNYNDVAEQSFTVTIVDTTAPTGEIKIEDNSWKQFINTITFGLFFKNNVDVTITADGTGSAVAKVEYLLSGTALDETSLLTEDWTELTIDNGKYSFAITSQNKTAVYVRITDEGGNVMVINSDGIVVYEDSASEGAVSTSYKAGIDVTYTVVLNGNTIKAIANGTTSLALGMDYTVNDDVITLKAAYLDTLDAGEYTFTVSYNPMGVETDKVELTSTFDVKVERAAIESVSLDVTAPEAGAAKQTTVSCGTNYSAAISWDCESEKFGFNTAYTATVTLTADSNHKFASGFTVSGWNVSVSADGVTATLTKTYEATRKEMLTGITEPEDATLTKYYTNAAEAAKELPATITYTTESGEARLGIQWACENYNPVVTKQNTFTWTMKATELEAYDTNNMVTTGSITVTNADPVAVNNSGEDKEIAYDGNAYDVSKLFAIDENAGAASYAIVGGTGDGILNGSALTVTKLGTIEIKLTTAAEGAYAAGEATATLTVNKGNGLCNVEISDWTYGQDAKAPVVSCSTNGTSDVTYLYESTDGKGYSSSDAPVNAGNYKLTVTFAETDWYKACTDEATFTIEQKELTAAINGTVSKVYDSTREVPDDHSLSITLTGFVSGGDVSATATYVYDDANAGTTKINATGISLSGADSANYKVAATVSAEVGTITKRDIRDAEIVLGDSLTDNGTEQTQTISSVTVIGQRLDEGSYTVTGNTATDAGTYTLTVTITDHRNFTGSATKEYVIARIQLPAPMPEDGNIVRLEMEVGISEVPEGLRSLPNLDTPAEIELQMQTVIAQRNSGISQSDIAVYDVTLMYSLDGVTWIKADEEHFPDDGLTVLLPYPEGTGKDSHNFTVAHMFTSAAFDKVPGDVEYPEVTKTTEGISFKVTGLSPISVGWEEVRQTEDNGSGGEASTPSEPATTPEPGTVKSPKTGDGSDAAWYLSALLAAGLYGLMMLEKRKREEE